MTENSMIERVEVLERQNRRMWRIGAGVIFVAGAMLLMGQAPAARTIEANEFVLRDSKGTARARLSMDGDMPKLILLNANGKDGVVLYQASDTSGISLNDGNGRERAFLYASNSGSGLRIEDGEQTLADLTGSSMLIKRGILCSSEIGCWER